MNYKKLYHQIIEKRKNNPLKKKYGESHHIIPKSLGGCDNKNNLIELTAREHFIAHFLLTKVYKKDSFKWHKMNHAFMFMKCCSINHQRYFNSRLYESCKMNFSKVMKKAQSGKKHSQYGTMWICNIELKKNKKIQKDMIIPNGWVKGRNRWRECKYCKNTFIPDSLSIFCSDICRKKEKAKSPPIFSKETREKLSIAQKRCKTNKSTGTKWINDGIGANKRIPKKDSIPEGFKLGRIGPFFSTGTKWINDGVDVNKKIQKKDQIPEGFKLGRIGPLFQNKSKEKYGKNY